MRVAMEQRSGERRIRALSGAIGLIGVLVISTAMSWDNSATPVRAKTAPTKSERPKAGCGPHIAGRARVACIAFISPTK